MAATTGAVLGTVLASDGAAEALPWLRAWVTDRNGARNALATIIGIQVTLVTIALSTTTLVYQTISGLFSPRLYGIISLSASLNREILLFVLSSAYTVGGVRELSLSAPEAAPRPVVLGGLVLLLIALTSALTTIVQTFRRVQVEEILQRTCERTLAATRRLERAQRALAPASSPPPAPPPQAIPIHASRSGYLIGLDLPRLERLARRFGLLVRLERRTGDFVARGEALGWFTANGGVLQDGVAEALARGVFVDERRSPFLDVGFGLRVLADIADRALSAAINDPTTARQTLHQMRVVLRRLVDMPLGDVALIDERGELRVSVALPQFQDYLATALDGPSRYGAVDADIVSELLDVALEVGRAAHRPERRAAVREVAARVIADAARLGNVDAARLAELQRKERAVAVALEHDPAQPKFRAS